jgi:hypothetical protein
MNAGDAKNATNAIAMKFDIRRSMRTPMWGAIWRDMMHYASQNSHFV